jgi:transglutaminase-like putative cysteine protease
MNERKIAMGKVDAAYLLPTDIINSNHEDIIRFAAESIKDTGSDSVAQAVKLYYRVRDEIWYDPYTPFYRPEHYLSSNVLKNGKGYCVSKASLLCALGRVCGIPSRIGFVTVRNHLATRQLIAYIGSDLFVYHGFVEFYLNEKWVKATPAFNAELCQKHRVQPLEFNGFEDSIFQPYNLEKELFMEYVADHGTYADIPVDIIVDAWKETYGENRINRWIAEFEKSGGMSIRNFLKEDVIQLSVHP